MNEYHIHFLSLWQYIPTNSIQPTCNDPFQDNQPIQPIDKGAQLFQPRHYMSQSGLTAKWLGCVTAAVLGISLTCLFNSEIESLTLSPPGSNTTTNTHQNMSQGYGGPYSTPRHGGPFLSGYGGPFSLCLHLEATQSTNTHQL